MAQADNKLVVTSNDDDFPITLTARSQGFKRTFENSAAVRDFLLEERQWWTNLQKAASQSGAWRDVAAHAFPHAGLNTATKALERFGNATNASAGDTKSILGDFANGGPVLRDGKQGKVLQELADNVPGAMPILALAEAVRMKPSILQQVPNYQVNTFDLISTLAGLSYERRAPLSGERAKLDGLLSESDGLQSTLTARIADFSAWDEIQRADWAAERAAFNESFKEALTQGNEQLKLHLAQADARLDAYIAESAEETDRFKKRVREDVVLEVPTTFWDRKANGHLYAAIGSGIAFALVAGGGVWLLAAHGVNLISSAFHTIGGLPSDSALLALVPLAFITIPALAFAWVLRHISRVLVQNLSLGADARLRATITSTFKALASDRDMSDAELAIALQALFRPIESKDHAEIAPPNLAELLKLNDK